MLNRDNFQSPDNSCDGSQNLSYYSENDEEEHGRRDYAALSNPFLLTNLRYPGINNFTTNIRPAFHQRERSISEDHYEGETNSEGEYQISEDQHEQQVYVSSGNENSYQESGQLEPSLDSDLHSEQIEENNSVGENQQCPMDIQNDQSVSVEVDVSIEQDQVAQNYDVSQEANLPYDEEDDFDIQFPMEEENQSYQSDEEQDNIHADLDVMNQDIPIGEVVLLQDLQNSEKEKQCTICIQSLEEDVLFRLQCGHIFHEKCLKPWTQNSNTCPTCRAIF